MRVKENLSSVLIPIGKNNFSPPTKNQVGRVYGVVTTENTPTKAMFEKVGGFSGIGSIFYLDYNVAKNIPSRIDDPFLDGCNIAKPLYPQFQYYPVLGELIYLIEGLPSPVTQFSNTTGQKYYVSPINLWNNQQQNSQPADVSASLGLTFVENPNIKKILSFEGDHILQGRQGTSLRFSTTTKLFNNLNEWSTIGNENDPITILANGLKFQTNNNFYVERINQDLSSIYLTSTQKIPLQTDKTGTLNPLTKPLSVSSYTNSQIILNSDRIVLNSKKDEVMLFAKSNIELNTKNIINLNADERIHLNSNKIFIGNNGSKLPYQPALLGYETIKLFEHLQTTLSKIAYYLSTAVSTPEGAPITSLKSAGTELFKDAQKICDLLDKITSKKIFIS